MTAPSDWSSCSAPDATLITVKSITMLAGTTQRRKEEEFLISPCCLAP
jgi:hypothetical protein